MSGEGKARHRLHEMPLIVVSYPCFMPFDFLEEIEVLCSISISNKRLLSCSKHIKIKMFNKGGFEPFALSHIFPICCT